MSLEVSYFAALLDRSKDGVQSKSSRRSLRDEADYKKLELEQAERKRPASPPEEA
jgi:hypothetical protein